jgi:L-seryl-tRNA(Ser) seleniumtransferase
MSDPRRLIPGLDRLLESEDASALLSEYPRPRVVGALRGAIERVRHLIAAGEPVVAPEAPALYVDYAREGLVAGDRPSLAPVINATGVVLHTNLGRAPLAPEALEALETAATGYSNLEYDLETGARGSRYDHCVSLLTELTGAEDALVVNNCAAALVLILSALARGRGVVVSRGELVEIGGGFRVPEILEQSGAELVEVGSTNRTRPVDYEEAIAASGPAVVLKVHRSNFRISGFTEEASLPELVRIGAASGIPVVHDLGSGLLLDAETVGLPHEPTPQESVSAGVDLVAFSGDKLLGGPQAGIIVGSSAHIATLRKCPLCRALRVDKTTLAALEATLRLYRDPANAITRIPTLRMLSADSDALEGRGQTLADELRQAGVPCETEACISVVGGGTYPGVEIPSRGVRVILAECDGGAGRAGQAVAGSLREQEPPVVGRIDDDGLHLDLRTVLPGQEPALLSALLAVLGPQA